MNRLRELREDRDLTLAEVGAAIGATPTTVARYEAEKRALTAELIHKFCDLFGVTSDYLLGRSTRPVPVSKLDMAMLEAYRMASPEARATVDFVLDKYKKEGAGPDVAAS